MRNLSIYRRSRQVWRNLAVMLGQVSRGAAKTMGGSGGTVDRSLRAARPQAFGPSLAPLIISPMISLWP